MKIRLFTTEASRRDLARAASELEAMGDFAHAARAYALASDIDGQARTLARAGDVEALDQLLGEQQARDREAIARRHTYDEVILLSASGRRRDAAATARTSLDEGLRERGRSLDAQHHFADVLYVAIFIDDDDDLGEHGLAERPDGVHDLARLARIAFLDRAPA